MLKTCCIISGFFFHIILFISYFFFFCSTNLLFINHALTFKYLPSHIKVNPRLGCTIFSKINRNPVSVMTSVFNVLFSKNTYTEIC